MNLHIAILMTSFIVLGRSILNVISAIVFGSRYEKDNPEFKEILDFTSLIFAGLGASDAVVFLPWLRFFPLEGLKKLRKGISMRDPLIERKISEHRESFDGENLRDVTDAVLKVTSDEQTWRNINKDLFTEDHLELIIAEIFIAGSETTLTTLRWCILYLLYWPEYQDSLYKEIIKVVGTERYPDINDRSSLHLLHATINETLRYSAIAPLGVPHKATEKSEIDGKSIPKNAHVMFNLWNIHHDEQYWKNPKKFYPERWLDENGTYTPGCHLSYIPFSAGRRVCLGEVLAKHELFTFLSRLIRDFRFEKVMDTPLPSLDGELGVTLTPALFRCVFKPRNNNIF